MKRSTSLARARSARKNAAVHAPGFTLIEVLFALAIVGLALGAAAIVFRTGLVTDATAAGVDGALDLAQSKLDGAVADDSLRPGTSEGLAGRYRWRLEVAPADDPESAGAGLTLLRVEAEVSWRDGVRERQVDLATLSLVP